MSVYRITSPVSVGRDIRLKLTADQLARMREWDVYLRSRNSWLVQRDGGKSAFDNDGKPIPGVHRFNESVPFKAGQHIEFVDDPPKSVLLGLEKVVTKAAESGAKKKASKKASG